MTEIGVEHRGAAAVVTIQRAERLNAITFAMIAEIRSVVDQAVADPAVTGVVITGSGRAFSAGLDMDDLARSSRGWSQTIEASLADADRRMRASLAHPDLVEGVASFVERRPPRFAPLASVSTADGPEQR